MTTAFTIWRAKGYGAEPIVAVNVQAETEHYWTVYDAFWKKTRREKKAHNEFRTWDRRVGRSHDAREVRAPRRAAAADLKERNMSEKTEISWTDATFNPWWGCQKVSPACDNCYAERDAHRFAPGMVLWGVDSQRREFGDKHWNEPLRWARTMPAKLGRRPRVFCSSMADVFDNKAPEGARERLWNLIESTPELDWLLLTKRVGNVKRMVPERWMREGFPPNVWLGITVVTQEEFDRDVVEILRLPARVKFLSMEPLLEWVGIHALRVGFDSGIPGMPPGFDHVDPLRIPRGISWVIVGGESGPKARPLHPDWVRTIRDYCKFAGVPFHFKQWGEWAVVGTEDVKGEAKAGNLCMVTLDGVKADHYVAISSDGKRRFILDDVGKKAAGRTLDGQVHDAFPVPR